MCMKKICFSKFLKNHQNIIILIIISLFLLLSVKPFFNFPLNDGWYYDFSVRSLLFKHELKIHNAVAPILPMHILNGTLFSMILGYSHNTLRLSTIFFSVCGVVGLYKILRELDFSKLPSFFGSLLLLVNPLYFNLSQTFMTDIPFLSMTILSILFYIKAMKRNKNLFYLLTSIFSIFSFSIRQCGILTILGIFLHFIIFNREKINFKRIFILFLLPLISVISIFYWYYFIHTPTQLYIAQAKMFSPKFFLERIKSRPFNILAYIGFFSFPLIFTYFLNIKKIFARIFNKKYLFTIAFIIFLVLGYCSYNHIENKNLMPYGYNNIHIRGLGAVDTLSGEKNIMFSEDVRLLVTVFSLISMIFFTYFCVLEVGIFKKNNKKNILYFIGLIYFSYLLIAPFSYDRYFIILLPTVIVILLKYLKNLNLWKVGIFITIFIFSFYSWGYTQDYINWNQARWDGIHYLLNKGIHPSKIQGGFEYCGLYFDSVGFLENYRKENPEEVNSKTSLPHWPCVNDKYVVSFSPLSEYEVIKKINYKSLVSNDYIYILKEE